MQIQPFFYIIQHVRTGKYYAGFKTARANPNTFMTEAGYQTSSKDVKYLIRTEGLHSFRVRKIRVFADGKSAYDYETRFLRKVNAADNSRFFNKNNNSDTNGLVGKKRSDEFKAMMSNKMKGRSMSVEQRAKLSKSKLGKKLGPFTNEHKAALSKALLGKKKSRQHVEAMILAQNSRTDEVSAETRAKLSKIGKGKIVRDETREKIRLARIGTTRSDETKAKLRAAWILRKEKEKCQA